MLPSNLIAGEMAAGQVLGARVGPIDPVTYRLGYPGRNPRSPYLHLFLHDDSGSVFGYADTTGRRFEEIGYAINVVARSSNDKTAVAMAGFDQPSVGTVPPGRLDDQRHLRRLRANLRIPPDARGISKLDPSLTLAEHWATTTSATVTLTVLSDFELFDEPEARIHERIRAFPGQVFAVVLGGIAPPDLVADNVTVIEIRPDTPPGTLATAIWNSLTTGRPGRRQGSVKLSTQPANSGA